MRREESQSSTGSLQPKPYGLRDVTRSAIKLGAPVWRLWAGLYRERCPQLLSTLLRVSGVSIRRSAALVTGQRMSVNPFDAVGGAIYRDGCFEPETVAYVQSILKPGMTFVDVGANIGQYTLIASRSVGPAGRVFSFEPHPHTFAELNRHVAMNDAKNVQTFECALSDSKGKAKLWLGYSDNAGANSLNPTINTSGHSVEIKTERMDDQLRDVDRIDLMKIDVEGAELLVLNGGIETIERTMPILVVEFSDERFTAGFGYSNSDIVQWLTARGFQLFHIRADGLVPFSHNAEGWENVACIPPAQYPPC